MHELTDIKTLSTQEIAKLPAKRLMLLQQDANEDLQQAKRMKERISDALDLKYKDLASVTRIRQGKESGVVHFEDGDIQITADMPKRVTWDQKQLDVISKRIQESGEDPQQYVDINYKVPERKYSAWPDAIRSAFQKARTIKFGQQNYMLIEGGEQ